MISAAIWLANIVVSLPESSVFCALCGVVLLLRIITTRSKKDSCRLCDYASVAFVLMQFLTLHFGYSSRNIVHFTEPLCTALALYFVVRLTSLTSRQKTVFYGVLSLCALFLASVDVYLFLQGKVALSIFPKDQLPALHASLQLLSGGTRNDGAMLLLSLLPFPTLLATSSEAGAKLKVLALGWITLIASVTMLLLTFSRGIYLALAAFLIATTICLRRVHGKRPTEFIAFAVLPITIAIAIAWGLGVQRAVLSTAEVSHSVSQQRSEVGRLVIWRERLNAIKLSPWLGKGGNSDGFEALRSIQDNPELPFTARAYNAPLELLLSCGVVGLSLFITFIGYPITNFLRGPAVGETQFSQKELGILTAALFALIVRDMTYSSLVLHGATIVVTWLIVALAVNVACERWQLSEDSSTSFRPRLRQLAFSGILFCEVIGGLSLLLSRAESAYQDGREKVARGEYAAAMEQFARAETIWRDPMFYMGEGLAAARLAENGNMPTPLWKPLGNLSHNDELLLLRSKSAYERSIQLSSQDSTLWLNLGWDDALLHRDQAARDSFQRATDLDPADSASHVSLGLLEERSGNLESALLQYEQAVLFDPRLVDTIFFSDLRSRAPWAAQSVVQDCLRILGSETQSPLKLAAEAELHSFLGQEDQAAEELHIALDQLPNLSYAWVHLATVEKKRSDTREAYLDLRRALTLDQGNGLAANGLAALSLANGEQKAAETFYMDTLRTPRISTHAQRTWRIYRLPPVSPDDLGLTGFLEYLSVPITTLPLCGEWMKQLEEQEAPFSYLRDRVSAQENICRADEHASVVGS